VARVLGHSPSSVEYMRLGGYHIRTAQRRMKTTWKQIIAGCDLRYTPRTSHRIPTTQELQNDLLRVARELDHAPTRAEYQMRGRFDSETVRRRSGKQKWEDALVLLAGLDREEIKFHQAKGGCYRTTNEWLAKLNRLSIELGHAPTTAEANAGGINAYQLCRRLQGNWTEVLKTAGVNLRKRSCHARILSTDTQTLIEDVIAVSRRLAAPEGS
jgi:HNH endonuclease